MALSVYLNFDGNCREAVEFYADVFNAEMQETFWSKAYASVTDRFGIPWQLDLDT